MVTRRGHSLVELIVAMMILGITLSAVAATSVVALRITRDATSVQEAAERASVILDSLVAGPLPTPGSSEEGGARFEWEVEPEQGGWSRLRLRAVEHRTGDTILHLTAMWAIPPPLPAAPSGTSGSGPSEPSVSESSGPSGSAGGLP